jgi:hypothetical protein
MILNARSVSMKHFLFAAALTLAGLASLGAPAQAMPRDPLTGRIASPIEAAQLLVYGGRRYCFYPDGWRGPGYDWCGYAWRRGFGWGGPWGWGGYGGRPRFYRDRGGYGGARHGHWR